MSELYNILYTVALVVIGLLILACLVRAIRGPRIADRVIAANMTGTLIVITICILSFLAVVLLTKVYMGIYREKHRQESLAKEAEHHD